MAKEYRVWKHNEETEEQGATIPHIDSLSLEATLRVFIANEDAGRILAGEPSLGAGTAEQPIEFSVRDLETDEVTSWTAKGWLVPCYEVRPVVLTQGQVAP